MKVTQINERLMGSLGKIVATRFEFSDREQWWKALNLLSELLGEVAPMDHDSIIFYNDKWFSNIRELPGARPSFRYAIGVFAKSDADLALKSLYGECNVENA